MSLLLLFNSYVAITVDSSVPTENSGSVELHGLQIEFLAGTRTYTTNSVLPIEYIPSISTDSLIRLESLSNNIIDALSIVEYLSIFKIDSTENIEFVKNQNSDKLIEVEYVLNKVIDSINNIEDLSTELNLTITP